MGGMVDDEFLTQLKGDKGIKIYREMSDNDSVVGAILFAIEMLIRQSEWASTPAEGDDDLEPSELLESAMHDMNVTWDDMLSDVLSFLPFGWSWHEIVYKRRNGEQSPDGDVPSSQHDDGKVGWRKLPIRAQDTLFSWDFDVNGGVQSMIQAAPPTYDPRPIPIWKSLHFKTRSNRSNPEGRSALRTAYRSWYYKQKIEEIEATGIERDLAGLPVGRVPPTYLSDNATTAQKAATEEFKKILINIRRDEQEAILWPLSYDEDGNKEFDLELLSSGGQRQFDTNQIITRYDQRIAMSVLADFIMLGHQQVGTQALSVSKVDLFTTALGAWMESISQVFNRHAIPRLMRLNGIDPARSPRIVPAKPEQIDLKELGEFIAKVAGAGMPLFPDPEFEGWLREQVGWPVTEAVSDLFNVGGEDDTETGPQPEE